MDTSHRLVSDKNRALEVPKKRKLKETLYTIDKEDCNREIFYFSIDNSRYNNFTKKIKNILNNELEKAKGQLASASDLIRKSGFQNCNRYSIAIEKFDKAIKVSINMDNIEARKRTMEILLEEDNHVLSSVVENVLIKNRIERAVDLVSENQEKYNRLIMQLLKDVESKFGKETVQKYKDNVNKQKLSTSAEDVSNPNFLSENSHDIQINRKEILEGYLTRQQADMALYISERTQDLLKQELPQVEHKSDLIKNMPKELVNSLRLISDTARSTLDSSRKAKSSNVPDKRIRFLEEIEEESKKVRTFYAMDKPDFPSINLERLTEKWGMPTPEEAVTCLTRFLDNLNSNHMQEEISKHDEYFKKSIDDLKAYFKDEVKELSGLNIEVDKKKIERAKDEARFETVKNLPEDFFDRKIRHVNISQIDKKELDQETSKYYSKIEGMLKDLRECMYNEFEDDSRGKAIEIVKEMERHYHKAKNNTIVKKFYENLGKEMGYSFKEGARQPRDLKIAKDRIVHEMDEMVHGRNKRNKIVHEDEFIEVDIEKEIEKIKNKEIKTPLGRVKKELEYERKLKAQREKERKGNSKV